MKLFTRNSTPATPPAPDNLPPDGWKRIVNETSVEDCPPGVRLLDYLTDKYEREENCRVRTVSAAIRAKIEAFEASKQAKAARHNSANMTASLRDYQKQSGDPTLAGYAKHKAAAAAKPAPAPARVKAVTRTAPAPKPAAPKTALEKFESLSGPEATAFYSKHRHEILAQEAALKNAANVAKNR